MFKSLIICMAIAIAITGCTTDNEPLCDAVSEQTTTNNNVRTMDEAIEIANHMASVFQVPNARHHRSVVAGDNAVEILGSHMSRSGMSPTDTLIYIVNYADEQGFAIIAAPTNIEPIIGITEQGTFSSLDDSENPGFQFYINTALDYIKQSQSISNIDGSIVIKPAFIDKTKLVYETIEPKLSVKWGQQFPEGYYCPNKICGCVQTAVAQILSYFELPKSIELTYDGRNQNMQNLDWAAIKKHVSSQRWNETSNTAHLNECEASKESHYAIARLCRQLGVWNNADYTDPTATGASPYDAIATLKRLLPSKEVSNLKYYINEETLYNEIAAGIVYIGGEDVKTHAGHGWVADGAHQDGTITYRYSNHETDEFGNPRLLSVTKNVTVFFHFNWGARGDYNGYFQAGIFDVEKGSDIHFAKGHNKSRGYDFSRDVTYFVVK